MNRSFGCNRRTLEITCKDGGPPSRNAIRRQRQRRQPPLLPFERKLEEQRQRQLQITADELSKASPIEYLGEPNKAQPTAAPSEQRQSSNTDVQTVNAEVISEVEDGNEDGGGIGDGSRQALTVDQGNEQEETAEERMRREITRKAQALMEIMQAGAGVEEAISRHSADIDDTMMELLQRRMEAARHLERQSEVLQGMELLQRRLKAELDRKKASLSMRLLDSLINILDEGEEEGKEEEGYRAPGSNKSRSLEVQKAARARLRSAFGAAPLEADVMSLATQLALRGQSIADELLEERIDGNVFIKEVTMLLERAMEEQQQLLETLEMIDPVGMAEERAKFQQIISERSIGLALVQEVLVLARSCMKPEL